MNKNDLGYILNIISNAETDYKKIAMEVARTHPTIFLKCARVLCKDPNPITPIEEVVFSLMKSGKFVDSVKEYRARHLCGLREAKEACDILKEKWTREGKL